jgi:1-aminocyclopropane-1-carboxylate deaminase/D-cysteine desulfhydrase-like pyridoxal-dependent ACC family enzyme
MCPFCLSALGMVVAGTVSTGGLAVLAAKVSRKKNKASEIPCSAKEKDQ